MNKKILFLALTLLFIVRFIGNVYADDAEIIPFQLNVNNTIVQCDINPFYDEKHKVWIPVRAFAESLGATVEWIDDTKSVTVKNNDKQIAFSVDDGYKFRIVENRVLFYLDCIDSIFGELFNLHSNYYYFQAYITVDNSLTEVLERKVMRVGRKKNISLPLHNFTEDLLTEIADRMDIEINIYDFEQDEAETALRNNEIDILCEDIITDRNAEEKFLFRYPYVNESQEDIFIHSYPYISDGLVLVADKDCNICTAEELRKSKFGMTNSDYKLLIDSSIISEDNCLLFDSEEELCKALDDNKIDAMLSAKLKAQSKYNNESDKYIILPFLYNKKDYSFAFEKEDIYLHDYITDIIHDIKSDGTYDEIYNKWFGKNNIGYLYHKDNNIIYNGYEYIGQGITTESNWRVLSQTPIGENNIQSYCNGMYYEAGDFIAEGSNDTVLVSHPPKSEFDFWYIRSDCQIPEINENTIERIEYSDSGNFDQKYYNCYFKGLGVYTSDKYIIKLLTDSMKNGVRIDRTKVTPISETLLLYSDELVGCVYEVSIGKYDDKYALSFDGNTVLVSNNALIDALRRVKTGDGVLS